MNEKSQESTSSLPMDVLVVEDVWGSAFDEIGQRLTITYLPQLWEDDSALKDYIGNVRALVIRNRTQVTRDLLAAAPMLEVIARAGVGLDNIDLVAANEAGVVVVAALGANATSVGEHAVGMAFAFSKNLISQDLKTKEGGWDRRLGFELQDRSWGVIGLGATGRETARIAHAIGMKVYGYDPNIPIDRFIEGVDTRVDTIEETLASCDFISLHVPLTPGTSKMVSSGFLSKMRRGSYLINSSRGGLVDEDALLEALDNDHLAGAALDVRVSEPPALHPLNSHAKVIHSPHVAGLTYESQDRITEILAFEIDTVLGGEPATMNVGIHQIANR
ncbi:MULTISPECIES: hydroxyacid dehydrogenase [Acidithrix]|uniref:(S)-sulfolactate dehydrogenase n=1 Tax=Acidithrix ferrooxidans TaxID=1280514 RepID=A0A0D8HG50_9ACTN|nr:MULTISPECIES: hydroxyacid dehydrogenase [Acidithrix]KJF16824.1 (S)-sulfolactate dehydrogenase [Acidithrix ferrooxidans]CAG4911898.1 unnamed protein product [Acidithrix sp. C25]